MFESSQQYQSRGKYSQRNRNTHSSYFKKGVNNKENLMEIDDNFPYQTTDISLTTISNKDTFNNKEDEVTEFQFGEDECESNKENYSCFANQNKLKMEEININLNNNYNNSNKRETKVTHNLGLEDCANIQNKLDDISFNELHQNLFCPSIFTFNNNLNGYNQPQLQNQIQNTNDNNNSYSNLALFNSSNCNKCSSFKYSDVFCNNDSNNSLLDSAVKNLHQDYNDSVKQITPFTCYDYPKQSSQKYQQPFNLDWSLNDIKIPLKPMALGTN